MMMVSGSSSSSSRRRRRCRSQLFRFLTIITPELLFIGDNPAREQKDTKLPDSSAPCTPPIKLLYIILLLLLLLLYCADGVRRRK